MIPKEWCITLCGDIAAKQKIIHRLTNFFIKDGNKWTLLEQTDSNSNESDLQMIDFEASLYDYLFDLEDLENN